MQGDVGAAAMADVEMGSPTENANGDETRERRVTPADVYFNPRSRQTSRADMRTRSARHRAPPLR